MLSRATRSTLAPPNARPKSKPLLEQDGEMKKFSLVILVLGLAAVVGRARSSDDALDKFFPLTAAPDFHKPVFEHAFVQVLDVSIPAGASVPAHVHPWPAVFITLEPAHLVSRNLAAEVVRDVKPPSPPTGEPKVEWREPDSEPASVTNVDSTAMRALRIELKFLAREPG